MRETFCNFFVFVVLCFLIGRATTSYCYPDYCQNLTDPLTLGASCLLTTPVEKGKNCAERRFDNLYDEKVEAATFTLSAYIKNFKEHQKKATAFNLSISDISFYSLTTRYQEITNENENACRYIQLYRNSSHPAPKDLYVSCPFNDATYEGAAYRLECFVIARKHAKRCMYTNTYIFYVPQHRLIEDGVHIQTYTPFIYIDVSDSSNVTLYIQQLPLRYNVTEYKVWLINNDTQSTISVIVSASKSGGHVWYNFSPPDGIYYVKVAALHPECGEHGCVNSTTPFIHIYRFPNPLAIMVLSVIWIPPIIVHTLYRVFKIYRKKVLKKMEKRPNCLLIYSPTHPAHVNVMGELAKYLRCCNINAMIDMFDIAKTASKDPGLWCNTAFQIADVVLVATSPPTSAKSDTTIVYRNIDNHLLRLLKENYPQRNKRYYAIYLPYCMSDHIPEEARVFKKFHMPKHLTKLVKTIYDLGCFVRFLKFFAASDREFLESIKLATIKMFEDEPSAMKNVKETDDLLPSIVIQESKDCDTDRPIKNTPRCPDTPDCDVIPQSFTTNIGELNLLGEIGEGKSLVFNSAKNDCEFCIDKLNL